MARVIESRPLLVFTVGHMLGLAAPQYPAFLLLLPLLLITHEWRKGFRLLRSWLAVVIGLALGLVRAPAPTPLLETSHPVSTRAAVISVPRLTQEGVKLELEFSNAHWQARLPGRPELAIGDHLDIQGIVHPLTDGLDGFARQRGIVGKVEITEWRRVQRGPWIAQLAESVRFPFERWVQDHLDAETAPLVLALCLNLDDALSDPTKADLRVTGTYHLVSASGLHVFVVTALLTGLLSQLPIRRGYQLLLLAAPLSVYCLSTGLEAPVLRASLMSLVGGSAYLIRRAHDGLTSLALAALIYVLWRPVAVFEAGFQLSFVTVASFLLFGTRSESFASFGETIRQLLKEAVRLPIVAFIASSPLVAYHFHMINLWSIPTNLLVALSASGIVVLGLLSFPVGLIAPPVGVGMLQCAGYLASATYGVTHWFASLPFADIAVPSFSAAWVVIIYLAMLLRWEERFIQP